MSSLRAALEEAIAANPDDLSAHAAHADLLVEEGDPRGEFIQVQLELETPTCVGRRRQALQQREQELLDAHQRAWLGPLAPAVLDRQSGTYTRSSDPAARVSWVRGWLEWVYLWWLEIDSAHILVQCPAARILRRLDLHHVQWYDAGEVDEAEVRPEDNIPASGPFTALYGLAGAPFLPHLRWLRVGEEVDFEDDSYNNEAFGQGLVEVVQRTPALEELQVLARETDLERLFDLRHLSRLRSLLVYHHAETYPLEVLANNPALAALETLRLHPASNPGEGSFLPRASVAALLRSPHFPNLRHLHLHGSDLGNDGCRDIVASGILKRLKVLDLRQGCIGDEGARLLADCPDIRRLEHLSLAGNELSAAGCGLLRGLGISVRLDGQHEPGSARYLWSGDME